MRTADAAEVVLGPAARPVDANHGHAGELALDERHEARVGVDRRRLPERRRPVLERERVVILVRDVSGDLEVELVDGSGIVEVRERDELDAGGHRAELDRAWVDRRDGHRRDVREAATRGESLRGRLVERARQGGADAKSRQVVVGRLRECGADASRRAVTDRPRPTGSPRRGSDATSAGGGAQPRISPCSSKANSARSARAGTAVRSWRMPSSVMIDSGQARWRIAAAFGTSSRVPGRITSASLGEGNACQARRHVPPGPWPVRLAEVVASIDA